MPEVWEICGDGQARKALVCTHGEDVGRRWSTWEDMDDRARWATKEKDEKEFYMVDLVKTFFSKIDLC